MNSFQFVALCIGGWCLGVAVRYGIVWRKNIKRNSELAFSCYEDMCGYLIWVAASIIAYIVLGVIL